MAGLCQDCDGCCRIMEVKEIKKAFGEPCRYLGRTAFGPGCTIYHERPTACQHYICLWLDSQRRPGTTPFAEELRPDVCKVVMGWPWGIDRDTLHVYPYPGYKNNWRIPPVSDYLKRVIARGGKVVVIDGKDRIAIRGNMAVIGTEEEFERVLS